MIGGIDIQVPTRAGESSLEVAVRAIRQRWPLAVFENGITGERYDEFRQIPLGNLEELFVYRDGACANLWDEEGAIPSIYNTMIHIIPNDETLSLVIDEKDAAMEALIQAVEWGLREEIFCVRAEKRAA